MADFFSDVGQVATDFFGSITGATEKKAYEEQVAAQKALNQQVLELQKQKTLYEQTPEYRNQQNLKYVLAFLVFVAAGFALFRILKIK